MLNKKNSKILLAIIVTIVIITLFMVVIASIKKEVKPEKPNDKIADVIPADVRKLYRILTSNECQVNFNFDFTTNKVITPKDMSNDILLSIIFNNLNEKKLLSDNIKKEDYINAAKEVLGSNFNIPTKFTDFNYNNYAYSMNNKNISRNVSACSPNKQYESVLFSYSYNQNDLSVYVNYAYIENDKIYNIDGKLIDAYNKANMEIIMSKATSYVYNFKKQNTTYYLTEVTKAIRETK